jgi:MerR family copper efflux transcriptional regulator
VKIKQVEELVGITSKNIRFYESQGLLTPERADNGYREYHQDNIEVLKKIKLLRKIGISVEDIKSVLNDNVTLENCLEKQKSNLTNMYNLTEEIINQKCELNNLKTDEWLEKMENMEKEGIDFVNISKIDIHMKKKMGAIIGGAVMIVFMLFLIGMFLWGNSVDPIPLGLLIVLVAIPVVIIVCIIGVLIGRIREIDGGEEDEAAKY